MLKHRKLSFMILETSSRILLFRFCYFSYHMDAFILMQYKDFWTMQMICDVTFKERLAYKNVCVTQPKQGRELEGCNI